MSGDILRDFALDAKAISVLITAQSFMVELDIDSTESNKTKNAKKQWFNTWKSIVLNNFMELSANSHEIPSFLSSSEYKSAISELTKNRLQAGLVLLEIVAFRPYFPFSDSDAKDFIKLSINKDKRKLFLKQLSAELEFKSDKADELDKLMESTAASMTGKWWKIGIAAFVGMALGAITLGIAAPFIGGLFGAAAYGLYGAAAITKGLAAIGGGAVAAGGFGMAGGTAFLVGGGALLGFGAGTVGGHIISSISSPSALLQSVKLEVALKEFILQGQYDTAKAQEILIQQRNVIQQLERDIDNLRVSGEETNKRIKDLEKAVEILKIALRRNQDLIRGSK